MQRGIRIKTRCAEGDRSLRRRRPRSLGDGGEAVPGHARDARARSAHLVPSLEPEHPEVGLTQRRACDRGPAPEQIRVQNHKDQFHEEDRNASQEEGHRQGHDEESYGHSHGQGKDEEGWEVGRRMGAQRESEAGGAPAERMNMPILYEVKDWDKHFESAATRKLRNLKYVPLSTKLTGDGYLQLVTGHPEGPQHFAAWCSIIQVAGVSKDRGILIQDNGQPHDAESLALKTRMPAVWFAAALPRLASPRIGWLLSQVVENADISHFSLKFHENVAANRTEQKRTE